MVDAVELARAVGAPDPTEEQRRIIELPMGTHALVVAGAGSGKTATMGMRVAWLVANGYARPERILGLTFTRKAAGELADRVARMLRHLGQSSLASSVDDQAEPPTVSTYNSYAARIVEEHGLRIGMEPDARLVSDAAIWQLADDVVRRYDGPDEHIRGVISTVTQNVVALGGQMRDHVVTADQVTELLTWLLATVESLPPGTTKARQRVAELVATARDRLQVLPLITELELRKRERGWVTFGDQMAAAAELARGAEVVRATERSRYDVVLLDEFQDTSTAQLDMLSALFAHPSVTAMAVGDPHQSIYGWRGASANTLAGFVRKFADPGVHQLTLATTWRNDVAVLNAANVVATPLRAASAVDVAELRAAPTAQAGLVEVARTETSAQEVALVASWAAERLDGPRATVAVLCRVRSLFVPLVEELAARGVPYEVVGLRGLLATPEVSDLRAVLSVVADPSDGPALMRLLTGPLVRLGPSDLEALSGWARELTRELRGQDPQGDAEGDDVPVVLAEVLEQLPPAGWRSRSGAVLSDVGAARVASLGATLRALQRRAHRSLADLVVAAERAIGLDVELLADPRRSPRHARAQVEAFVEVVSEFEAGTEQATLPALLAYLSAAADQEDGLDVAVDEGTGVDVHAGVVQILTVHAAKGLEWDSVAVPGMTEGQFPSGGSSRNPQALRKEKGWTSKVRELPSPLRGDRDALPYLDWDGVADEAELDARLERHAVAGGEHHLGEERRLAYVALTRARHRLLLTTCQWAGERSTPAVPSRFLDEVRAGSTVSVVEWFDGDSPTNPQRATMRAYDWPRSPSYDSAALDTLRRDLAELVQLNETERPPTGPGGDRLDRMLELLIAEAAAPVADPMTTPEHLSTSDLVSLASDAQQFVSHLRRPMPTRPSAAARRGTAFHEWVERRYARPALIEPEELAAWDEEQQDAELESMQQAFLRSEWADRTPEFVELALETRIGTVTVRGRLDAAFRRPDGGYTVVDWKSGRRPGPADAAARAVQLAAYRIAFARWLGIDVGEVDGAFYYASDGVTVRPDLPDEAELRRLLAPLHPQEPPSP